MIVTNLSNLPKPLFNAAQPRKGIASFLTASRTTVSPRQFWLEKRHYDSLTEDVTDRLWAVYGTAVHKISEGHGEPGDIIEKRLESYFRLPKSFSGQTDRATILPSNALKLQDYKFTSVWSGIYGSLNDGLEKQLNSLCYLWRLDNYKVEQLEGILLFKDWKPMDALRIDDYPPQVMRVPVPLWDFPTQEKYLTDKINLLCQYENTPDAELPVCTEDERWASPAKYKVYKK
ncbi:MAG: hypothetical protein GY861_04840, partial [bacterium]|nr:hypothetical protein [bacterium]